MEDEKTISEIKELSKLKTFFIPKYQRGYRWQCINVKDLLNDLFDFINSKRKVYSMQPLVVKSHNGHWNVVDGQQRLTTIAILLNYLVPTDKHYTIEYESRKGQELYLVDNNVNIDQYHINQAYKTIKEWFESHEEAVKKDFIDLLSDVTEQHVKFIWFETPDDELKTFVRLNKDKIALTNAELIKALLLRKGNFEGDGVLMQKNIAVEWNNIENTFQDDSFWRFIRPKSDNRETRIDYIFEIIRKKDYLNFNPNDNLVGTDKYATFRYFYEYVKKREIETKAKREGFVEIWDNVKKVYSILNHWFNDLYCFHYIGFLVVSDIDIIDTLLDEWNISGTTIPKFVSHLKTRISKVIAKYANLDYQYELNGCPKTNCFNILLLFNIESILVRNRSLSSISETQVAHKFPFHLLKEENWNIEHIASNTDNSLEDINSQKEWLKTYLLDEEVNDKLKREITTYIKEEKGNFDAIKSSVENIKPVDKSEVLSYSDKNKIWNFCLLDESTNKSYGNAIFPIKRRTILGKEMGIRYIVDNNLDVTMDKVKVAYVPQCTINVFAKTYTNISTSPREWTIKDATAYKQAIATCLKDFGVTL